MLHKFVNFFRYYIETFDEGNNNNNPKKMYKIFIKVDLFLVPFNKLDEHRNNDNSYYKITGKCEAECHKLIELTF